MTPSHIHNDFPKPCQSSVLPEPLIHTPLLLLHAFASGFAFRKMARTRDIRMLEKGHI